MSASRFQVYGTTQMSVTVRIHPPSCLEPTIQLLWVRLYTHPHPKPRFQQLQKASQYQELRQREASHTETARVDVTVEGPGLGGRLRELLIRSRRITKRTIREPCDRAIANKMNILLLIENHRKRVLRK